MAGERFALNRALAAPTAFQLLGVEWAAWRGPSRGAANRRHALLACSELTRRQITRSSAAVGSESGTFVRLTPEAATLFCLNKTFFLTSAAHFWAVQPPQIVRA